MAKKNVLRFDPRDRKPDATGHIPPLSQDLAGWEHLGGVAPARSRGRTERVLSRVSTSRFLFYVILFCMAAITYVNHVYATQELLTELEQVRRENQQLHLRLNRLKATFDAATAPSLVIPRARALGLEESAEYGPEIHLPAP